MSTSGITVSQLSRDDIINAALRKLMVIGEGQVANATQLTSATQALNSLVAEFRTLGMSIWARKTANITLVNGQQVYTLGVGQSINIPYPLRIYTADMIQSPTFDTKIMMNQLSFNDFSSLPDVSTGAPVNFVYQPKVNVGLLTVWPIPDASVPAGSQIRIEYQSPFEYFVTGIDTPDFPEEWGNALIYQTALLLADEFGVPEGKKSWIEKQADKHLMTALNGGTEEASLYIQRDWSGYDYR